METWAPTTVRGVRRLVRDGATTPHTALTDLNASQSERIAELQAIDWLPPDKIAHEASLIFNNGIKPPALAAAPGRAFAPVAYWPSLLADPAEPANTCRDYLWPRVDTTGRPAPEQGERVLFDCSVDIPRDNWRRSDGEFAPLGRNLMQHGIDGRLTITDRRAIVTAKFSPPTSFRDDRSVLLGTVAPLLDDIRAASREAARRRAVPTQWYAAHIRYEWICGIGRRITTKPRKRLFGGPMEPKISSTLYFIHRIPSGTAIHTEVRIEKPDLAQNAIALAWQQAAHTHGLQPGAERRWQKHFHRDTVEDWHEQNLSGGGYDFTMPELLLTVA